MAPRPLAVLLACLLALLFGGAVLRGFARRLIYPASGVGFPPGAPGVEVVAYRASDGQPLKGALVTSARSGRENAPAVLYFHGNAESAAQNLPLAEELARSGVDVFLAEYRGYGGLPGRPDEAGLTRDALAAFDALAVPPGRLVIVGRSLGTGPAVELAYRKGCAHLVLIAPYTSMIDMGRLLVGPLAPLLVPDRFDSLARAPSLLCPVTIGHGTRDEVVPFTMGQRLAASMPRVRLVPFAGRGHNDLPGIAGLIAEAARQAPSGR